MISILGVDEALSGGTLDEVFGGLRSEPVAELLDAICFHRSGGRVSAALKNYWIRGSSFSGLRRNISA